MSKFERLRKYIITLLAALFMIAITSLIHASNKKEEKHIRIGYIYVGDASNPYTYNFVKAQKEIEETYGVQVSSVVEYNVSEGHEEAAIQRLIDAKCDLIFGTSYGYGKSMKSAAKLHPEIVFCQATCDNSDTEPIIANYHTFMGRIFEGRYVSGYVAGLKAKELIAQGKLKPEQVVIGYVGAFPYAEVISGYTAFYLGVKSVVPEASMRVKYTNSWSDYVTEKRYAKELIEEGCVIISQHSDTMGPAVACEEATGEHIVIHVGYNQSMLDVAPTTSLTGCRINWAPYMVTAVEAVLEDKDVEDVQLAKQYAQDACAGFDYDWVEMLELNEIIAAQNTKVEMNALIDEFKTSPHTVFVGDYTATNPFDPADTISLKDGYEENATRSAPSFGYVLDEIIIE